MITQKLFNLLLMLAMIALVACGGGSDSTDNNESDAEESSISSSSSSDNNTDGEPKNLQEAMSEVKKVMEENGGGKEVVNFRDLKELLPESMMGMERTEYSGEKAGAFGMNIANAKAEYEEGDKRIEVNIADVAGVGTAMMSMASWSTIEVDRESDDGFERTTVIDGNKAFEKYDSKRKDGELNLIIKDRFIVTLKGDNVEEKDLRKALDKINLKKLARMG